MSRIDELIQELCPDGVEYVKIGALAQVGTGSSDRKDANHDGIYPFYVRSKDVMRIDSYEFDEEALLIPGEGGIGEIFHYVHGKYALHQRAYRIHFTDARVHPRFAYFYFSAKFKRFILQKAVSATVTSIRKPMITDFPFPMPPLEVQREIARVLDKFTQLEAELEAELEARRDQYEHYRIELLTPSKGASWSTLGGVSTRASSGATPKAGDAKFYDGGTIPWLRTGEVKFGEIWDTEMRITDRALAETAAKWIPENCVIVAISGATAARSAINKIPLTTNQHCCNLEIDPEVADYRYVFYWVSSKYEELKSLGRGARADLNSKLIKDFRIPVPTLEEQRRIVEALEGFDRLINDNSIGLPAELAARRKQYEHYRDRLLTFKELKA